MHINWNIIPTFTSQMRVLRKYIKIFIVFTFPVYLLLLINSISNMHVHVLSNGMVVRHAHPMQSNDCGDKSHDHDDDELCFYQGFCLNYFDNSIPLNRLASDFIVIDEVNPVISVYYTHFNYCYSLLRGPPIS